MAQTVPNLRVSVIIEGINADTDSDGDPIGKNVYFSYIKEFTTGTGTNQLDRIWSDASLSIAATTLDLDLAGGALKDPSGDVMTMVECNVLAIHNTSIVADARIDVGGGGANSVNGNKAGFNADADESLIGPDGLLLMINPMDGQGIQIVAGTGDILRLDSGAATIVVKGLIAGHSA